MGTLPQNHTSCFVPGYFSSISASANSSAYPYNSTPSPPNWIAHRTRSRHSIRDPKVLPATATSSSSPSNSTSQVSDGSQGLDLLQQNLSPVSTTRSSPWQAALLNSCLLTAFANTGGVLKHSSIACAYTIKDIALLEADDVTATIQIPAIGEAIIYQMPGGGIQCESVVPL